MDRTDLPPGGNSRGTAPNKPVRRRNRMIHSCLPCRQRKIRCSKASPSCMNCLKAGRECLYISPLLDEVSQMRLAEIKEKQGSLERQLERDVARSTSCRGGNEGKEGGLRILQHNIVADGVRDDYSDEDRDLEFAPLATLDLTYDDADADSVGDMIDLGIRIGKMRITERIGGLSRPRISEEISASLSSQRPAGMNQKQGEGGQLPAFDNMSDGGISDGSLPEYLQPGDQYIVPTSGLVFGQLGDQSSVLQFLPYRNAADRLMAQYFSAVHVVAPCSHRPSLEAAYASFWEEVHAGVEPRLSTQTVIFAALFSAIVSMDEHVVVNELGGFPKNNWLSSLKMGTEAALSRANFLRTTKIETMQGFIVYMLALCRAEISRAHSVLIGAAVRMAECMGLHRDGEEYGLTPLETHVRRLMWHQLCFLDIRTCEAQGPRPVIRREDYDTKLPLNCDEEEITHAAAPTEGAGRWTTNTLPLIRFEINEMMRIIWLDRRKLETRKTTLTAVLAKIETFRQRLSAKYDGLLDARVPVQRYARCVMYLLTYRLHVMALHPYHLSPAALVTTACAYSSSPPPVSFVSSASASTSTATAGTTVPSSSSCSSSSQSTAPPSPPPPPPPPPPRPPPSPSSSSSPSSSPFSLLPPRLNQLLVTSGIMVQELAIQLETDPAFAPWAWYAGAYSQHQVALLLAAEVFHHHHHHHHHHQGSNNSSSSGGGSHADRIWPCLDWVFGLDRRLPREVKAMVLLAEVQDRTAVYMRLRGMRGPMRGRGRGSSAHAHGHPHQAQAQAQAQAVPTVLRTQGQCRHVPPASPQSRQKQQQQPQPQPQQQRQQPLPSSGFQRSPNSGHSIKLDPAEAAAVAYMTTPTLATGRQAFQQQQQQQQMMFPGLSGGQRTSGEAGGARFAVPLTDSPITTAASHTSTMTGGGGGVSMRQSSGNNGNNNTSSSTANGVIDTIDWDTVNSLFPTDPQNGGLSVQGFHGLNLGVPDWGS